MKNTIMYLVLNCALVYLYSDYTGKLFFIFGLIQISVNLLYIKLTNDISSITNMLVMFLPNNYNFRKEPLSFREKNAHELYKKEDNRDSGIEFLNLRSSTEPRNSEVLTNNQLEILVDFAFSQVK